MKNKLFTKEEISRILFHCLTGIELNQQPVSGKIIAIERGMTDEVEFFEKVMVRFALLRGEKELDRAITEAEDFRRAIKGYKL